jgi:multicomponent Na+:H+ antiporter subunit G
MTPAADLPLDILGALVLLAGTVFLFLGGLGVIRMPDAFNRIQAGTKATTLGTILTLLGAALLQPDWSLKLLLIGLFLLFTNPLSSQVLARAAHRAGVAKAPQTKVDALTGDRTEKP